MNTLTFISRGTSEQLDTDYFFFLVLFLFVVKNILHTDLELQWKRNYGQGVGDIGNDF